MRWPDSPTPTTPSCSRAAAVEGDRATGRRLRPPRRGGRPRPDRRRARGGRGHQHRRLPHPPADGEPRVVHLDDDRDVRRPQGLGRRRPRGECRVRASPGRGEGPVRGHGESSVLAQRGAGRADHGRRRQVPRASHPHRRGRRKRPRRAGLSVDLGLADRVCVVTGASRGIGRETARMLCAEGASVLLVARGGEDLAEARDRCAAEGGRAEALELDVTGPGAGDRMRDETESRFGGIDVLVNNAGASRWRDLDDVPEEDWYAAWELNVMAPLRALRAAIPRMAERGWGRVVNVASTAAKRPSANMAEYSVAKAAELSLSRLFADRHAKEGVLVNAICPGPTKSELWMDEGGLLDQSQSLAGHDTREDALEAAGAKRPI